MGTPLNNTTNRGPRRARRRIGRDGTCHALPAPAHRRDLGDGTSVERPQRHGSRSAGSSPPRRHHRAVGSTGPPPTPARHRPLPSRFCAALPTSNSRLPQSTPPSSTRHVSHSQLIRARSETHPETTRSPFRSPIPTTRSTSSSSRSPSISPPPRCPASSHDVVCRHRAGRVRAPRRRLASSSSLAPRRSPSTSPASTRTPPSGRPTPT